MKANILLIRHAQAHGNIAGKIGYSDEDDRLTPHGIEQARSIADSLSEIISDQNHVVYISQASRTLQTAYHARLIGPATTFVRTPALDEISMGSLVGKTIKDYGEVARRVLENPLEKFPEGESITDVRRRMRNFLTSLHPDILHICISHGVAISSFLGILKKPQETRPRNASITQICFKNNSFHLI